MGSVVSDVSNSVNHALSGVENTAKKSPLAALGILNPGLVPLGITAAAASEANRPDAPQAPGIDDGLESLKRKQIEQAQQFRGNLGNLKQQNANSLQQDANQMERAGQEQMDNSLNQRGLLYGGLAQGKKAGVTASNRANLAGAINKSNSAFDEAADTMDAQAMDTAQGIQRQAQQIQNDVYAQAMAQMNSRNALLGQIASTAATAALR